MVDWSRGVTHSDVIARHPFFGGRGIRTVTAMMPREHGNAMYRVATDAGVYVVRFVTRKETDPDAEYRAARLAQGEGIGSEILFFDPEASMMILDFVSGEHRSDLTTKEIGILAQTLRQLHGIETEGWDFPLIDLPRIVSADRPEITEAFETIERYPANPALCHNDLTPRNMIWQGDRVLLIDFEFAAIGDMCFDLAAVCVEFSLDTREEKALVRHYFGAADCPSEQLAAFKTIYRALRRQWFARHGIDQIP